MKIKPALKFFIAFFITLLFSACASNSNKPPPKIEQGRIIQLKKIPFKDAVNTQSGSVGISIGSGGHSGIYGAVDIGRIFSTLNQPEQQLELIIKKHNGELVVINKPLDSKFKVGDKVKLQMQNGQAVLLGK